MAACWNEETCVICLDAKSRVLFSPCRHFIVCVLCSTALQSCPLCRSDLLERTVTDDPISFVRGIEPGEYVDLATVISKIQDPFGAWLRALQGKGPEVPRDVMERVLVSLVEKGRMGKEVGVGDVKKALKRLNLHRWYDSTHQICERLGGRRAPLLSPDEESRLKKMFRIIQEPLRECTKRMGTRHNFYSYSLFARGFSRLIGRDDLLLSIPVPNKRVREQEAVWIEICHSLAWKPVPLV